MPIGFWAINRREVKESLMARTGELPNEKLLDRAIGIIRDQLEIKLDELIEQIVKNKQRLES